MMLALKPKPLNKKLSIGLLKASNTTEGDVVVKPCAPLHLAWCLVFSLLIFLITPILFLLDICNYTNILFLHTWNLFYHLSNSQLKRQLQSLLHHSFVVATHGK